MDYRRYKADGRFLLSVGMVSAAIGAVAAGLFYDSVWGFLITPAVLPVVWTVLKRRKLDRRKRQLKSEFGEVMVLVSGNLQAGYSLERSFMQVQQTEGNRYGLMGPELVRLVNGIACGRRIETMIRELAERSGISEILEFARLIETAGRYGGSIPQLIRQMTAGFSDAESVETEIETAVAAKRLEGRIMLAVPVGILVYFRVCDPSYIQALYETAGGRIFMTAVMAAIAGCAAWIEKIIRIEV